MALADYFARNALAAAQVLAGFDEKRIREVLDGVRIGITVGSDAAENPEGHALVDLLIRLLSRLYPVIAINALGGAHQLVDGWRALARRINPNIEFDASCTVEVGVGSPLPSSEARRRVFAGSEGWTAFVGTERPFSVGVTEIPFGPGIAASLAAANVFRLVFMGPQAALDKDAVFSALDCEPHQTAHVAPPDSVGDVVLVGAGAIGNGVGWALSRLNCRGTLHGVDHQAIDLGNLQRYVMAERDDEGAKKVAVLGRSFSSALVLRQYPTSFDEFLSTNGYKWVRMLVALDSAADRRATQASLPKWIANSWTQPGDLGVSTHNFREGACVCCLYLPSSTLENEDTVIATALGITDRLMQVRTLLYTSEGVPRELVEAISVSRNIPLERLQQFEGRPLRNLYTEGFCGGAVIPLGGLGTPREEVHVPLAHQSALAGILLAAAVVREALGRNRLETSVTRLDVMRPMASILTQPAAKDPRGICICQDVDYQQVYQEKYQ